MMLFSLNAKRRVPLHKQSLLKQRQIDQNVEQSKQEVYMCEHVKDKNTIVKDVITYDIGESSNDLDLIASEPQMEEPIIETLSNIVATNNETTEKEPSVKVYKPILDPILEEVCNNEEVSGIRKEAGNLKVAVELNKKKKKNGRK